MFLFTRIKVINSNVRFNWAFLFDDPFVKLSSYHIAGCLKKCPPFKYHYEKLFHAWRIHLKKIASIELIKFLYAKWWKEWSLRYAIQLTQIFFHWNWIKLPHSTFAWSGRNLARKKHVLSKWVFAQWLHFRYSFCDDAHKNIRDISGYFAYILSETNCKEISELRSKQWNFCACHHSVDRQ